jgi:CBS domain containing-hemolysin-like protein
VRGIERATKPSPSIILAVFTKFHSASRIAKMKQKKAYINRIREFAITPAENVMTPQRQ